MKKNFSIGGIGALSMSVRRQIEKQICLHTGNKYPGFTRPNKFMF